MPAHQIGCAEFRASPRWQAQLIAILVDALRRLREGETVVDPTIVSRLLGRRRGAGARDVNT